MVLYQNILLKYSDFLLLILNLKAACDNNEQTKNSYSNKQKNAEVGFYKIQAAGIFLLHQ